jgi:hypothetical protein
MKTFKSLFNRYVNLARIVVGLLLWVVQCLSLNIWVWELIPFSIFAVYTIDFIAYFSCGINIWMGTMETETYEHEGNSNSVPKN